MLALMMFASVLTGLASLVVSVLSGHPPVIWLLSYTLAGTCGLLAVALVSARRGAAPAR